ncbi:TIGR01777 family oxidoreductase [Kibdelosporangium persicum]|uniref:Nucleoside-diphosphate sugar epimerase n=1 Tax=Kibdelosporangium persicum TaxID=2698649 RepID=A0ABX2FBC9_9PSEU|nr:TIGR01777 family oxidoreductase [Kibdelosporangium persicum]NRN68225.1 Nucleoside-diphosphate sugar epimerase [Kibdelosporangium persicum]
MRVVVAGSSGLIGTELVSALRREGHEVLRLVRRPSSAPDERTWDPPAARIEDGALDGAEAVINLCGAPITLTRLSNARKQLLLNSRVEPTEVLAAAVAEHGIPLLVNASAVGYYGDTGGRVVDETTPAGTGFLPQMCKEWEAATRPAADAGARVALLRTGLVLSKEGGLLGPLRLLFSVMLGGRLGDGRQYMPWIHHTDQINAMLHILATESLHGPVNMTAPNPVTNAEFTRALSRAMGRPAPWVAPKFALRLALGELADEGALASQHIIPKALQDNGFTFQYNTVDEALGSVAKR